GALRGCSAGWLRICCPRSGDALSSTQCSPSCDTPIELCVRAAARVVPRRAPAHSARSEEHTSELQSRVDLVCRLLLEKKNVIGRGVSCFDLPYLTAHRERVITNVVNEAQSLLEGEGDVIISMLVIQIPVQIHAKGPKN